MVDILRSKNWEGKLKDELDELNTRVEEGDGTDLAKEVGEVSIKVEANILRD